MKCRSMTYHNPANDSGCGATNPPKPNAIWFGISWGGGMATTARPSCVRRLII